MQTFLSYPDFDVSAQCLDDKRLPNQVNEALVILKSNLGFYEGGGWVNHPAAKMWKGHEGSLHEYRMACIRECESRGIIRKFAMISTRQLSNDPPPWVGDEQFHLSHRSNLLWKNREWYQRFFGDIPDDLPYIWPELVQPV